MSLESHIDALQKEHDRLDSMIAQELRHPGADDLELTHMKREKLRLKDEIVRLSGKRHVHAG
ncbi:MAG: YdcH family protein [Pseudomonadota bacterium]